MKRILIASILGIAASVTTSFGTGYIIMENYYYGVDDNGVDGSHYSAVTISPGYPNAGHYLGSEYSADLLYSLNGGASYQLAAGSLAFFFFGSSTATGSPTTDGAGTFVGTPNGYPVIIPDYTTGPVTFIVEAFLGSSYSSSTFKGQSAPFTIASLQTWAPGIYGDLINETAGGGLQPFSIPNMPEPSTGSIAAVGAVVLALFSRRAKRRLEEPTSMKQTNL